jgi:hypothetical protein
MIGCMIASWSARALGRKRSFLLLAVIALMGSTVQLTSVLGDRSGPNKFWQLVVGKVSCSTYGVGGSTDSHRSWSMLPLASLRRSSRRTSPKCRPPPSELSWLRFTVSPRVSVAYLPTRLCTAFRSGPICSRGCCPLVFKCESGGFLRAATVVLIRQQGHPSPHDHKLRTAARISQVAHRDGTQRGRDQIHRETADWRSGGGEGRSGRSRGRHSPA